MHIDDAQLRAYLDGEVEPAERGALAQHLDGCATCLERLRLVQARADRVGARLAHLAPSRQATPAAVPAAYERWQAGQTRKDGKSMLRAVFGRRSVWAGITAATILIAAFSFAPVRTWAGQFLGLFRVQQITVLPLDLDNLASVTGDRTLAERMQQLFAESVTVHSEPGEPVVVASAEEASALAGFNVRLPDAQAQRIAVQDGAAFDLVVDRDQAQAILNEAGRSDLQLPEALDGATIAVDIPTGVRAHFGECGRLREDSEEAGLAQVGACQMLLQVPSPSVTTPPDVSLAQLAEIGLQFSGMSAAEAQVVSASIDWNSTLVVPIPREAATYEQVSVDEVTGTLILHESSRHAHQEYVLLWVKEGIVYALSGWGEPDEGLALANSLN